MRTLLCAQTKDWWKGQLTLISLFGLLKRGLILWGNSKKKKSCSLFWGVVDFLGIQTWDKREFER
jgi:hypothetical protein